MAGYPTVNASVPVVRAPMVAVIAMVATLVAGCLTASCATTAANTITLYNGQHPQLTEALVSAFEKQTGIHVRVRNDDGIVLADQLLEEGASSPADVYLTENTPELMLLQEHHLLAQLPASTLDQVPPSDSSPQGDWVGISLRVSALVYNPSLVSAQDLPAHLVDLAQPKWKGKVGIAPTDSDFVPLVGAVIATYGKAKALSWLEGLKDNAVAYQDIETVVAQVNSGQVALGIINQYYWYRFELEVGAGAIHSRIYYFPDRDVGAIENISGAAVLASSQHNAQAQQFVSFLVSPQAQHILAAGDDFEYPARVGIAPNPALPSLSQVNPAVISVVALGDDQEAASLLQTAGLT